MKKSEFGKHLWKHGDRVVLKDGQSYLLNNVGLNSACVGCITCEGTVWYKCDKIQSHLRQDGSEVLASEQEPAKYSYSIGLEDEVKKLTKENKMLRNNLSVLTRHSSIQKVTDKLCNLVGNAASLENNISAYLDQLTLAHKRMDEIDAILKEVMMTE